ncbi:MAG: tyrosine-type recombinase/integrase, partial [Gammaproteobacteria bacterium]
TWIRLGSDYGEAMRAWAELVAQPKSASTMNDLFDRYMLEVAPLKAPVTYKGNQREIQPLRVFFGEMRPTDVEPTHVYQYLDERGKSARIRANREKALLSHVFSTAIRWGSLRDNPCRNVKRLTEKPRDRYIEDWELQAFVNFTPGLICHYVTFKYLTGLRQGDILNLRLDAVRDDGIHVKTGKTGRRLIIQWTRELRYAVDHIKALRTIGSMFLFSTRRGQPYTGDGFRAIWQRTMKRALEEGVIKERFTEHDIRAKSGTDADARGLDAQALLGHEDAGTTRRYIRHKQAHKVAPLPGKILDNPG